MCGGRTIDGIGFMKVRVLLCCAAGDQIFEECRMAGNYDESLLSNHFCENAVRIKLFLIIFSFYTDCILLG